MTLEEKYLELQKQLEEIEKELFAQEIEDVEVPLTYVNVIIDEDVDVDQLAAEYFKDSDVSNSEDTQKFDFNEFVYKTKSGFDKYVKPVAKTGLKSLISAAKTVASDVKSEINNVKTK